MNGPLAVGSYMSGDVVILRRLASVEAEIELTSTLSSIDISSNRKPFTLEVIFVISISFTSSNNQFSEFRISNNYNKTLFICLINSRARHSAIYILKSGNLNLKEASKCVLRIIKKIKTKILL